MHSCLTTMCQQCCISSVAQFIIRQLYKIGWCNIANPIGSSIFGPSWSQITTVQTLCKFLTHQVEFYWQALRGWTSPQQEIQLIGADLYSAFQSEKLKCPFYIGWWSTTILWNRNENKCCNQQVVMKCEISCRDKTIFVPGFKHVYFCCKVCHFNMEV